MKRTSGIFLALCTLAGAGNAEIDGHHGDLWVTGTLVASPCVLAPESAEQTIDLGKVGIDTLSLPGSVTPLVPVHLILDHCPGERNIVREIQRDGRKTLLSGQQAVMLKIAADAEPADTRYIRVKGSAAGIALRLQDEEGMILEPGMLSRPQILNPGRNDVVLQAQLLRTPEPLQAGDWHTVINIGLEYE